MKKKTKVLENNRYYKTEIEVKPTSKSKKVIKAWAVVLNNEIEYTQSSNFKVFKYENYAKVYASECELYEVVPEIVELKFGCVIVNQMKTGEILDTRIVVEVRGDEVTTFSGGFTFSNNKSAFGKDRYYTVIGRPIRLADVLLAIGEMKNSFLLTDTSGFMAKVKSTDNLGFIFGDRCQWNLLKDSLEDQSDETVEFIYNLIK